jgi:hypothetical protein
MKPTLDNIDKWFFDSLEGNLSTEQQELLSQFIAQHPELELEQEAWAQSSFEVKPITFEPKAALYRKKQWGYKPIAAASLLLLLFSGSYFYFSATRKNDTQAHQAKASSKTKRQLLTNTFNRVASLSTSRISNASTTSSNSINSISSTTPLSSINANFVTTPTLSAIHNSSTHSTTPTLSSFGNTSRETLNSTNLTATNLTISSQPSSIGSSSNMPFLAPSKITGYRTDLRFEALAGIETALNGVKTNSLPKLQRFSQFAQKELGLSNNQTYDLLLPGKSNIDANISSVGTLSQTRFQSMSSARTGTEIAQGMLGQQMSLDGYARKLRAGFGIQGNYKQFAGGAITDYEIGLVAAPKIAVTRQIILEPAARLRMGARHAAADKLQQLSFIEFENSDLREVQVDTAFSVGRRLFYKDLDFSLAIQTPIFFASAQLENAFAHFDYAMGNNLNPSNSRAPQQLTLAIGTQYASRNEKMRISPYFIYTNNRLQTQYYAGAQININKWQLGLSVANNQQYQASLGFIGKHSALLLQSTQHQLLSLNAPSYLHQITLRIYSQNSRQARRYISL